MQSRVYVMHVTSLEYLSEERQNLENLEMDINIFPKFKLGEHSLLS